MVFADAGRRVDYGQLSVLAGILFRKLSEYFLVHTISSSLQTSKCPVKAVGAANILAASEGMNVGKVLREVAAIFFGIAVELVFVVDFKDLFTSLSLQRNPVDRSIRPIFRTIRFEYETDGV